MPKNELQGVAVLVTRPAHQAGPLSDLIAASAGEAVPFPVLAIEPPRDPAAAAAVVDRLDRFNIAIFVSANAVHRGADLIHKRRGGLPSALRLAAVGGGTAHALEQCLGRGPDIRPEGRFDSEGLLATAALQAVHGRSVVIFRGEGGRELLAETLRGRGAHVEYAEVYRRVRPDGDVGALRESAKVDIITVTSAEGLENLFAMAANEAEREWLRTRPLVVMSGRAAKRAAELGAGEVLTAVENSDRGLVATIATWADGRRNKKTPRETA
jgi:uroporphyrinogen-III synthase